jgi:hypothetical protein
MKCAAPDIFVMTPSCFMKKFVSIRHVAQMGAWCA